MSTEKKTKIKEKYFWQRVIRHIPVEKIRSELKKSTQQHPDNPENAERDQSEDGYRERPKGCP